MKENWYALFLCIIKEISPDQSIRIMKARHRNGSEKYRRKNKNLEKQEFQYIDSPKKLLKLKEKLTYKQIAKIYDTYPDKVYKNIKHYRDSISG